jgi:hypothetical protein
MITEEEERRRSLPLPSLPPPLPLESTAATRQHPTLFTVLACRAFATRPTQLTDAAPEKRGRKCLHAQGTLELQEMAAVGMSPLPLPLPPLTPPLLLKPLLALLFLDAPWEGGLSGFPPSQSVKGDGVGNFYRHCGSCLYGHVCFCCRNSAIS